jgi:hypothetical protein
MQWIALLVIHQLFDLQPPASTVCRENIRHMENIEASAFPDIFLKKNRSVRAGPNFAKRKWVVCSSELSLFLYATKKNCPLE